MPLAAGQPPNQATRCPPMRRRKPFPPTLAPPAAEPGRSWPVSTPRVETAADLFAYWLGLPLRWAWQAAHNGLGILRVIDITWMRPLPPGLISPDHPWATGINPDSGRPVWHQNVLYRSARDPSDT